jgi:hypothetical protein
MKRQTAKIKLHRESLLLLDAQVLMQAGTAGSGRICPITYTCLATACPPICTN